MNVRDAVFWYDRKEPPLPALAGEFSVDAAVVGGGMMGLMCARTLAARGQRVCLVEADTCGGGASGRSSGFITPDSELEFQDLVKHFGAADGRRLWEFALGGVTLIRDAIQQEHIECDFQVQEALFTASSRGGAKTIVAEHAAREAAGLASTPYSRKKLPEVLGTDAYFGAVRFGGTFGIDSYRTCVGLRRALVGQNVPVFERSPVTRIRPQGVETAAGSVRAENIVICADRFLPELGLAPHEIYHVQTFLALSQRLNDSDAHRMFPAGPLMVWDTDLTYKYFRLTGDQRLLIGGGTLLSTYARHKRHRPEKAVREFTNYLAARFPGIGFKFDACWPGLIGISKDFAPVVGRHPRFPSVSFAGGAAGLPWAAALGRYLAERVLDGRKEFDSVLAVDRHFPVGRKMQALMGAPAAFALSHGIVKFLPK